MSYVAEVNSELISQISRFPRVVVYGQNVNAGSKLGGLGKGLAETSSAVVINTTNTENSLVGMGMGMMLRGQPSVLLLKQEDFLILGMDQLVNTWNALRVKDEATFVPFVIGVIVVDSGWEGPQSGLNATSELASLARIPWVTPTGLQDLAPAMRYVFQGGPRMLAVSQRLFKRDMVEPSYENVEVLERAVIYDLGPTDSERPDVLVSVNFSLPEVLGAIAGTGKSRSRGLTLINYFAGPYEISEPIAAKLEDARSITVISDEKTEFAGVFESLVSSIRRCATGRVETVRRVPEKCWSEPSSDAFDFAWTPDAYSDRGAT